MNLHCSFPIAFPQTLNLSVIQSHFLRTCYSTDPGLKVKQLSLSYPLTCNIVPQISVNKHLRPFYLYLVEVNIIFNDLTNSDRFVEVDDHHMSGFFVGNEVEIEDSFEFWEPE